MNRTLTKRTAAAAAVMAGLSLAACAGPGTPTASIALPATANTSVQPVAQPVASTSEPYVLSAAEHALSCKDIMGRMQVSILELRSGNDRRTTMLSHAFQKGATTVFGGTRDDPAPASRTSRARARRQAYNAELVAKGCKSYNLDEVLQPKDVKDTPVPTIPAPATKPKAK